VTLLPATVYPNQTVSGTVTLAGAAGPGGALVQLLSSSADVSVPEFVAVPAGAIEASFPVTIVRHAAPAAVTIMASYLTSASATLSLAAGPALSFTASPATVAGSIAMNAADCCCWSAGTLRGTSLSIRPQRQSLLHPLPLGANGFLWL
jgi:hypothetical protein